MNRFLSVVTALILMSGCATYHINSTSIDNNSPLQANHGVVAVQIINNTDRLSSYHKNWGSVLLVRLDNMQEIKELAVNKAKLAKGKKFKEKDVDWSPEVYELSSLSKGVIDSQIFVGSMPEGRYAITRLYSYYSDGNVSAWINMPVWDSAGEFSVKSNKLSNLGSLVFQPLLNIKNTSFWGNNSKQKAYVTRIAGTEQLQTFIQSYYPNIAASIDFSGTETWNIDGLDKYREQLSKLSRDNAFGNKAIALNKKGVGAIAARFGQLRILNKNGEWLQKDLPTNGQISSILEVNNKILVGSEQGKAFVGNDFDTKWETLNPVAANQAITWLGKGKNYFYAMTSSDMEYILYSFDKIDSLWTKIGSYTKKPSSSFFVQNGGLFPIITTSGNLRIFNDNKISDYNSASTTWSEKKGEALVKVSQSRDGTLLGLEVSQWDGVGDQIVSFDNGDNWKTINRSLSFFGDNKTDKSLPAILKDGTVITLGRVKEGKKQKKKRSDSRKSILKVISNTKENLSSTKTWQSHGNALDTCYDMLPELTFENTIFFLCDEGEIVSTSDFGFNWKTEVNIDIQSMQNDFDAFINAINLEKEKEKEKENKKL